MKDYDLEEELAAAMLDRSRQEPPRGYDVDDLIGSIRRRRRRLRAGAAAAVVIVALGAGFASRADHDRASVPVQASTASRAGTPPSSPPVGPPTASASASKPASPAAPARTANALFLAALRYQNPATRSEVDPAEVAALFADESTYQRIWGADSRGVTCGALADGVLAAGAVLLYRGTERLDRAPSLGFDGATGKVTDLTCATVAGDSKGDDPTVSGFYGGLVAAAKSGDSTAMARLGKQFVTEDLRSDQGQGPTAGTCSFTTPPFWLADNPSSGTLTHGWTVNLGGHHGFPIEIDEEAKISGSCGG
ncbi:hypothetical protein [Streptomyces sp. CBMA156]|uniref:hypothetical protein n=1 Tax=Streptomyces sp. CBMA156 TaxID=1930280 RepID=UPI00166209B1|nr:hypothetical protein [Streptomyces sp. CBMA156]MBD0673624.1 hypothetical protein [Streptomyces sp. CBMA156]